jgi:hypothetical protein
VLVYRFWRKDTRDPHVFVILNPNTPSVSRSSAKPGQLKVRVKSVRAASFQRRDLGVAGSPSQGFLKNGKPYVVYRMMLYSDEFNPYLGKKVSYGGCYMLPLGLPPENRV